MEEEKKVFGTNEWSVMTANFMNGCMHDCKYCYAKEQSIRFKRNTPDNWVNEQVNPNLFKKKFKKVEGRIMFPSTHDITPDNIEFSIEFLRKILLSGNEVLVVSKPHLEVIRRICEEFGEYRDKILFRFTIGTNDSEIFKFWEPGAPGYDERRDSLIHAFNNGFSTSISIEPILDMKNIDKLINDLLDYVTDSIWLGKMNFLFRRLKMNGVSDSDTLKKGGELIGSQSNDAILDLYNRWKDNPKIKWKDSIKNKVNIEIGTIKGLDI